MCIGYIEPGSTPDKSVHDKIRLFHQRSVTGQPTSNKELFGGGGQVKTAKEGFDGGGGPRPASDDKHDASDAKPPKPRQVEKLVRQSRDEAGLVRKRGRDQVRWQFGRFPMAAYPSSAG